MDNEYYYPKLEELHHGMVYEQFGNTLLESLFSRIRRVKPKWIEKKFDFSDSLKVAALIKYDKIRIKKLTADFIMSIGAKSIDIVDGSGNMSFKSKGKDYRILFIDGNGLVKIFTVDNGMTVYFNGKIKNSNVFINVLKLIGAL